MVKFLLIVLGLLIIASLFIAGYTAKLRRDVFECTNDAKLSLVNMKFRFDPDSKSCQSGFTTVARMNQCVSDAYKKYDEEQVELYIQYMEYIGDFVEDPEDMKKIQNDTCADKFPEFEVF